MSILKATHRYLEIIGGGCVSNTLATRVSNTSATHQQHHFLKIIGGGHFCFQNVILNGQGLHFVPRLLCEGGWLEGERKGERERAGALARAGESEEARGKSQSERQIST